MTVTFAESWIKNLVLHPNEVNKEYNCMDKHQALRNYLASLEEIEQIEFGDRSETVSNNIQDAERIGKQIVLVVEDS